MRWHCLIRTGTAVLAIAPAPHGAWAATSAHDGPASSHRRGEVAAPKVEAYVARYDSAWNRRDTSAVSRILAPQYQYFTSRGRVSSRAESMAMLSDPGYRLEGATRSEITVTLSGPVAVVSSRWQGRGTYRGEPFVDDQRCGQTWVLVAPTRGTREAAELSDAREWQLLSEHCVQIVPGTPAAVPD